MGTVWYHSTNQKLYWSVLELRSDNKSNGGIYWHCVNFNKIYILKRRFIVGSIISDNDSTMKALSKHRYKYIKVSTHIFASSQPQRNQRTWHKEYHLYYLHTTMVFWSNTLLEYCMEKDVGSIASWKEEDVSKNCDFLKVNTYCGFVVKNNI